MRPFAVSAFVVLSALALAGCAEPHTIDITPPSGGVPSALPNATATSASGPPKLPAVKGGGPTLGADGKATLVLTPTWKLATTSVAGVLCLEITSVKDGSQLAVNCVKGEHTAPILFADTDVPGALLAALVPASTVEQSMLVNGKPLRVAVVPLPTDVSTDYRYALTHTETVPRTVTLP